MSEVGATERFSDPVAGIYGQLVATYSYDPVGNVRTLTGPVVVNALSGSHQLKVTYGYDDNSRLLSVVDVARRNSPVLLGGFQGSWLHLR